MTAIPLARVSRPVVLLALLIASLSACVPGAVGEITEVTPVVDVVAPRLLVDAAGTRIERFDPPGAGAGLWLTLAVTVANPNPFDLVIERISYELMLEGDTVAMATLEPRLLVPAMGTTPWSWSVEASLAELPRLWAAVVGTFAGAPLAFEVEGRMRFVSEVFAFTTGVRPLFAGELAARQAVEPPRLSIVADRQEVLVARPDAPALRFAIEVTNPGDVGYFVSARGVQLALLVPRDAGEDAASAVAGAPAAPSAAQLAEALVVGVVDLAPLPVPAGATVTTDLVVVLDPARLPAAAVARLEALLAGHPTPFVVDGPFVYDVLGIDSFRVPLPGPLWGVFGQGAPPR